MGAYYLDEKGQIYADVAYRLGVIVKQYDSLIENDDEMNFDSTMCVSFLQNLLTIYCEYWKNERYGLPPFWRDPLYNKDTLISASNYFGIEPSMVIENNIIKEKESTFNFLTHLRNALSHPTTITEVTETQSTGYYSKSNSLGRISEYIFIDSPDVKVDNNGRNRPKQFLSLKEFETFLNNQNAKGHPFNYEEVNGKFELRNHRFYKVRLTSSQLKLLVVNLSSLLAQPVQKNWDGRVLNPKILDYAA
jgi:hypothetical protein